VELKTLLDKENKYMVAMRYGEFISYDIKGLSFDENISMSKDCKDISYDRQANILDCST